MNIVVTNIIFLVLLPTLVVSGFFYAIHYLLSRWERIHDRSPKWQSLLVIVIGVYFLGHPLYPALVPLIRASTPWMFALGVVYAINGLTALVLIDRQHSSVAPWIAALVSVALAVLVARGHRIDTIQDVLQQNIIIPSLLLSLPLASMFPFGHQLQSDRPGHHWRSVILIFGLYAIIVANSVSLTETIRGPAGLVFTAFGCLGVLLGIPLYVLGMSLTNTQNHSGR